MTFVLCECLTSNGNGHRCITLPIYQGWARKRSRAAVWFIEVKESGISYVAKLHSYMLNGV